MCLTFWGQFIGEWVFDYDLDQWTLPESEKSASIEFIYVPGAGWFSATNGNTNNARISFYNGDYGNKVDGARIYRQVDGGQWKKVTDIKSSQFSDSYYSEWTDTLPDSGKYGYKYCFYKKNKEGEFSKTEDDYYHWSFDYMKAPTIEDVTVVGNKITVKWSKVKNAERYSIRVNAPDYWYSIADEEAEGSDTTSYTFVLGDRQDVLGKILELSVAAGNNDYSVYSERATIEIFICKAPKIRSSMETAANQMHLAWDKCSGVSGYEIQRYDTKTKKWTALTTISGSGTVDYIDKNLSVDTEYTYRIRSYRKLSGRRFYSDWSTVSAYTHPSKNDVNKKNTKIKDGVGASLEENAILYENVNLYEYGYSGGIRSHASSISDFIDYKGYYTYAFEHNNYIYIKRVDPDTLELKKTIKIKKEYPLLGGVTCDQSGNYYIAWGQSDTEETGEVKTFAISKYDYKGNLIGTMALKGGDINVKTPFHAGNCVMTFDGNTLVCSFARLMYKSGDGLNHQASQVVAMKTSNLKQVTKYNNYASHSFDERILRGQNGDIVFVDLGDAYSRGVQVTRNYTTGEYTSRTSNVPIHFNGEIGNNYINAQLGDIAELSSGYVIAGSSAKSLESLDGPKQLYVMVLNKETLTPVIKGEKRTGTVGGLQVTDKHVIWLTNYSAYQAINPQMVAVDHDKVAVLWQKYDGSKGQVLGTYYAVISASGKVIQKATSMGTVDLNGTEELVYKDGCIYWTTARSVYDGYYDYTKNEWIDHSYSEVITHKTRIGELSATTERIWGVNKYKTAYEVSDYIGKDSELLNGVIIVNKNSPSDAISSGYLSKATGGLPVLFYDDSQAEAIRNYIKSNVKSGSTVYILGGKLAVPLDYDATIKKLGYKVERFNGRTKFDVNLMVLAKTYKKGDDILVVSTSNRMDGVPANAVGKPLLLVDKKGLKSKQIKWLKTTDAEKIYVIGNETSISNNLQNDLSGYAKGSERINGTSTRDISVKIANKFFKNPRSCVLMTSFGDGLCAPAVAFKNKAPIIVTSAKKYQQAKSYVDDNNISKVIVVGGPNGLSDAIVREIAIQ